MTNSRAAAICTTIQSEFRFPTDFCVLFAHDHLTKICGRLSFNFFFVYDHSTKNKCPHWLISFIYTRPFYQNIWSSFIYSFFYARPFDQKLGLSFIYSFCFHTTIRQKDIILFHLFFLLCPTIWSKLRSLIYLFLLFSHNYSTKRYYPLSFILFFFVQPFDPILGSSLINFLICTRPLDKS